jgi:hypothetical protein
MTIDSNYKHSELTDTVIGVFYEVYNELGSAHESQVLNYLRSTALELGLILNFGPRPQLRRLLLDNSRKHTKTHRAGGSF